MSTSGNFLNCTQADLDELFASILDDDVTQLPQPSKPEKEDQTTARPGGRGVKQLDRMAPKAAASTAPKAPGFAAAPPPPRGSPARPRPVRAPAAPDRTPTGRKRRATEEVQMQALDLSPRTKDTATDPQPYEESTDDGSPEDPAVLPPPKKRRSGNLEFKEKPVFVNSFVYDLNGNGTKTITCGNLYADEYPVMIVLAKLDSPNVFLSLTPEDWDTFKLYFQSIEDFFQGTLEPINDANLGRIQLRFKSLYNKPTLLIASADGKFLLQSPGFSRLKHTSFLIDLCVKEGLARRKKLLQLSASQLDTRGSPQNFHLYVEMLRCEAIYRTD